MAKNRTLTLKQRLWSEFGPVMDTKALCKVLHYRSTNSLNAAHGRGLLPFLAFSLPGRRGMFALTEEIAEMIELSADRAANGRPSSGNAPDGKALREELPM